MIEASRIKEDFIARNKIETKNNNVAFDATYAKKSGLKTCQVYMNLTNFLFG